MDPERNEAEFTWTARNVRPVVLPYLVAIFAAFMAFAHFVVHSHEAVVALLLAAVGAIVPTVPSILTRREFRLSPSGLIRTPLNEKSPKEPRELFSWEELSHLVPTGSGFKYYKHLEELNPLFRFWKLHVMDRYSGEFQVEEKDRPEVERRFALRGIPMARRGGPKQIPQGPDS